MSKTFYKKDSYFAPVSCHKIVLVLPDSISQDRQMLSVLTTIHWKETTHTRSMICAMTAQCLIT